MCVLSTFQFKQQGSMCREAATNCDVPEYCNGEVATVSSYISCSLEVCRNTAST